MPYLDAGRGKQGDLDFVLYFLWKKYFLVEIKEKNSIKNIKTETVWEKID